MIQDAVSNLLRQAEFLIMDSNIAGITIYYKAHGESVTVFHICDSSANKLDIPQLQNVIRQIRQNFHFQGYSKINLLTIVLTGNMNFARRLAQVEAFVWFVDLNRNTLVIYDNQPSDFLGVKKPLERVLDGLGKPLKKKKPSSFTPVNSLLVAVNVIVFLVMSLTGAIGSGRGMLKWGAMYTPYIMYRGEFYRLFTSMFLHFDVAHLTGNMIILLALGDNLERALGKGRYLVLYVLSGLGAGMCSFAYNWFLGQEVIAAGASGAIFGIIGALFYAVRKNKGRLEDMTTVRLGLLIVYVLYSGFTTPGIDNAAHVGGLMIGMLMAVLLYPERDAVRERKAV